jgi:16S rRNA (uracil1498-N3)-methyltransferase
MHLFYLPEISNGKASLDRDESKHALKVLRLKEGDLVQLVDGKGGMFEAEISDTNGGVCVFNVVKALEDKSIRPYRLHMAVAPTKNIDRFEWFLEKATEIGIDEITPVICEHSERRSLNTERCNRILVSAMKQSLKATLPQMNEPIKLKAFLETCSSPQRFIGYCDETVDRLFLGNVYQNKTEATVLIGPEGDFSEEEVELALRSGFKAITLGNSRLRTETAAVVATSMVATFNLLAE